MDLKETLNSLNQIGIALSAEKNLETLLEMIVQKSREFTHADSGSLYLLEETKNKKTGEAKECLRFAVAQCRTLEERLEGPLPFRSHLLALTEESVAGYCALMGKTVNLEDCYNLPEEAPYTINKAFDQDYDYRSQSMLVVPMTDNENKVIGVLQLINAQNESGAVIPFSREREELVCSIASQAAMAVRNTRLLKEIKELFDALMRYSIHAIEARSPHTAGHSRRVTSYALKMVKAVNETTEGPLAECFIDEETREQIRCAGWLHDIGKIGVHENVLEKANKLQTAQREALEERWEAIRFSTQRRLSGDAAALAEAMKELEDELAFIKRIDIPGFLKDEDHAQLLKIAEKTYHKSDGNAAPYLTPRELELLAVRKGSLTAEERRHIESHVEHTTRILSHIPFPKYLENVPLFAGAHHERLNGKGYPHGLCAAAISIPQRILAIADILDALVASDRPYKKGMNLKEAMKIIDFCVKDGELDGAIVEAFKKKILCHLPDFADEKNA